MACIEGNFFGNTTSLTIVSFTTARASAELPQILHFHTVTTMGILTSHSIPSWELIFGCSCVPWRAFQGASGLLTCLLQPERQVPAHGQRRRPAPRSTLSTHQPPSHQHLLIYFMVNCLPGSDRTAFLSPGAYNSSFLSLNHKDSPRDGYPEDYTHKLDWEIQIGRSKHRTEVTF